MVDSPMNRKMVAMHIALLILATSCSTLRSQYSRSEYNDILVLCDDETATFLGGNIINAFIKKDPLLSGRAIVEIEFDAYAKKELKELTMKYVGKNIAFFVGDNRLATAKVMEPILDGKIWISGYDEEEAKRILELLKNKQLTIASS